VKVARSAACHHEIAAFELSDHLDAGVRALDLMSEIARERRSFRKSGPAAAARLDA
jgi:hypothetical protein